MEVYIPEIIFIMPNSYIAGQKLRVEILILYKNRLNLEMSKSSRVFYFADYLYAVLKK